jgi:hypothetical protein
MAAVQDLPTELLNTIASYLLPDTIEAFALSCKTIFAQCQYILDKHIKYRKKYGRWVNRGPRECDMFYFLHEIAKNPLVAEYVTKLDIWDQMYTGPRANEDPEPWTKVENLQAVKLLIEEKVAVFMEKNDGLDADEWWDEVRDEIAHFNPDPDKVASTFGMFSAVTLLALLPNLQELTLHPAWPGDKMGVPARMYAHITPGSLSHTKIRAVTQKRWDKAFNMLKNLALLARSSEENRNLSGPCVQPYPLAKLATLLPLDAAGNHDQPSFTSLEPFFVLPNIQNFYSVSVTREDPLRLFDWTNRLPGDGVLRTSPVRVQLRRIEIVHGCCSAEGIKGLLQHCHCLEVFKYAHSSKYMVLGDFDAKAFVDVVGECVGATLKEFALRLLELDMGLEMVEDFQKLVVLEEVELDVWLFNDCIEDYDHVGRLSAKLPPSVRNVVLNLDNQPTLLPMPKQLLDGLKQTRHTELPKLESIIVRAQKSTENEQRRAIRVFAEDQGVEWEVPELGPYEWHPIGWVKDVSDLIQDW